MEPVDLPSKESDNPFALPMLQEIFTELRKGRHISIEDGALYTALAGNYESYKNLFTALGLTLVAHNRGFFYQDDDSSPRTAQKMVLFMAILVEHLDDQGVNLDQDLSAIPIHPSKLPHLQVDKYARVMAEADVRTEEALLKVLESMNRYGIANPDPTGVWWLRTPAYRILDILNMAGRTLRGGADITTEVP